MNILRHLIYALAIIVLTTTALSEYASDGILYREVNLVGGYSDIHEWTGVFQNGQRNSVGFESFQKYSSGYGDFMTTDVQMRFSYDDLADSDDAWALEVHNAWAELKLGLGREFRFGHFAPAYGLETSLDTHSALFQTQAARDIGFKKDWGLGYSGEAGIIDFEAAVQIGSGMAIERQDGSFLSTVRLSDQTRKNFKYGLSVLYGEVLVAERMQTIPAPDYLADPVRKIRVGTDLQWLRGPVSFGGEVSVGENDDNDVFGLLLNLDYKVPELDRLTFQSQYRYWTDNPVSTQRLDESAGIGLEWRWSSSVTVRTAYFHEFQSVESDEDRRVIFQCYFLGR